MCIEAHLRGTGLVDCGGKDDVHEHKSAGELKDKNLHPYTKKLGTNPQRHPNLSNNREVRKAVFAYEIGGCCMAGLRYLNRVSSRQGAGRDEGSVQVRGREGKAKEGRAQAGTQELSSAVQHVPLLAQPAPKTMRASTWPLLSSFRKK